jgi:hypothetical protein
VWAPLDSDDDWVKLGKALARPRRNVEDYCVLLRYGYYAGGGGRPRRTPEQLAELDRQAGADADAEAPAGACVADEALVVVPKELR